MGHCHLWEDFFAYGALLYQKCARCGRRRVVRIRAAGAQEVDRCWLETGVRDTALGTDNELYAQEVTTEFVGSC
jgi:hypothetical protein